MSLRMSAFRLLRLFGRNVVNRADRRAALGDAEIAIVQAERKSEIGEFDEWLAVFLG